MTKQTQSSESELSYFWQVLGRHFDTDVLSDEATNEIANAIIAYASTQREEAYRQGGIDELKRELEDALTNPRHDWNYTDARIRELEALTDPKNTSMKG